MAVVVGEEEGRGRGRCDLKTGGGLFNTVENLLSKREQGADEGPLPALSQRTQREWGVDR